AGRSVRALVAVAGPASRQAGEQQASRQSLSAGPASDRPGLLAPRLSRSTPHPAMITEFARGENVVPDSDWHASSCEQWKSARGVSPGRKPGFGHARGSISQILPRPDELRVEGSALGFGSKATHEHLDSQ